MSNMLFELKAAALLHTLPLETTRKILEGTQLQAALSILENWDPRLRAALETAYPHEINPPRGPPEALQPGHVENPLADKQTRKQHYYEAGQTSPEQLEKLAAHLNSQLRRRAPGDAYTLLYLLLEPLYAATLGPPGPPPGYSEAPYSHLDLAYAAATAANWYTNGEEPEGCLVAIDIASVQTFITASRRPGDHWAASWLVSALAWSTTRPLIEKYGPDTLLIPSPRLNPLLLYWAKARYNTETALPQLYEEALPHGWPSQPIAGSQATLLLPPEACPNIEETLQAIYTSSWETVVDTAEHALHQVLTQENQEVGKQGEQLPPSLLKKLLDTLTYYLEKIRHTPPLTLRTAHIDATKAHHTAAEISPENPRRPLYHTAYTMLTKKLAEPHLNVRIAPGSTINWLDTTQPPTNTQGDPDEHAVYRLCTSCSSLPAVIRLKKTPSGRRLDIWTPGQGYTPLARKDHEEDAGTAADTLLRAGILREHEGLCPYCLTKRLLAANNTHTPHIIAKLLRELVGGTGTGVSYRQYPSTSDIAMTATKLELTRWIASLKDNEVDKLIEELLNIPLPEGASPLLERWFNRARKMLSSHTSVEDQLTGIPRLDKEIKALKLGEKKKLLLSLLVATESEEALLSSEAAPIRAVLADAYKPLSIRRYYTILEADGDYVSRIKSGQILTLQREEIISAEDYYGEADQPLQILLGIREVLGLPDDQEYTLLLSIAYHQALSKGLMATALKDLHTIEEAYGYPVYLGGDDIKAFLPASPPDGAPTPLATAAATRINYWGTKGFNTVAGIPAPAPIARGRTYTLTTAHYRDPLPQLLNQANDTLEHIKEAMRPWKDLLQATYIRGGLSAAAPNTPDHSRKDPAKPLLQLNELHTKIGEKYSNSLPRDLYENTKEGTILHTAIQYINDVVRSEESNFDIEETFSIIKRIQDIDVKLIVQRYIQNILSRNTTQETAMDAEQLVETGLTNRYILIAHKEGTNPFFEAAKLLLILQAGER